MLMLSTDEIKLLLSVLITGAVGVLFTGPPIVLIVFYCYRRERNKRIRKYHRRRREKETLIEDDF